MRWAARDFDDDVEVSLNTAWDVCAVAPKHATNNELADSHSQCAVDEEGATACFIDEEEYSAREDDEECVLDA